MFSKLKMSKKQRRDACRLLVSLVLLIAAKIVDALFLPSDAPLFSLWYLVTLAIYLPAYICAGGKTLVEAASNISRGQIFDENFLMSIASLAALVLGEFTEGVAVMLFAGVGNLFESYATGNARGAIEALSELCPDKADVLRDGALMSVAADEVEVGEIIEVGAGRRIALDGIVEEGSASIDCSALTGESLPISVGVGDSVRSGTVNLDGRLRIRTTALASMSAAARIVATVEDAAAGKSKTEAFISKFAAIYTPAVCAAALVVAILPPIVLDQPFMTWIYRALSFLVVSCPCALVISVPLTFFGAVGGSAKRGILFKDNSKIELLADLGTVAFDKTGTLTEGRLTVCGISIADGDFDADKALEYASAAEYSSIHPIAQAISEGFGGRVDTNQLSDIVELPGRGRSVTYKGRKVALGNKKLMDEMSVIIPDRSKNIGTTSVYLAVDGRYVGSLSFADKIRQSSKDAVERLHKLGVKCVMLSGDNNAVVKSVADSLGMDECIGELLPEDKLEVLKGLIENGSCGFVGDGINDSPALARADVGFAMGGKGSDIAVDAADVVISSDDPARVPDAIGVARKTMRIAKENIVFALGIKLLAIVLITLGLADMWMAVVADVGVSIAAILNASRMLSRDRKG